MPTPPLPMTLHHAVLWVQQHDPHATIIPWWNQTGQFVDLTVPSSLTELITDLTDFLAMAEQDRDLDTVIYLITRIVGELQEAAAE